MSWSAEELVLVGMGALFLLIVATSFAPRIELSNLSRVLFAVWAIAFFAVAWFSAGLEVVRYPPFVWILPMVPLTIIGVLVRDAIAWHPGAVPAQPGAPAPGVDADALRRAAFFPPIDDAVTVGEGGDGRVRALAADPEASAQELADIAFTKPQLRATVASNPATPSNVLDWLASQGDPVVHAAIKARVTVSTRS